MFSKTWRVYRVAALKTPKRRVITDNHLFIMVFVFFCIDLCVLILWQVLDPIYVETIEVAEKRDPEIPNKRIISYIEQCTSTNHVYWLVALCAYKGLLLLFGTWLAWETRKVTIPALNDSKLIGICVYNTVVLCIVGVSVSFLIRNDTSVLFIFTSCTIIVCATLTLMILFVPKVVSLYRYPDGLPSSSKPSSTVGSGLYSNQRTMSINMTDDMVKLRARVNELEEELKKRSNEHKSSTENMEKEVKQKHTDGSNASYGDAKGNGSECRSDSLNGDNVITGKRGFTNLANISETHAL
ncbi:gamma-aminobutyric acid type B receptor subunit 2-like isoform X1 [Amphiura filiformis]|uniref:gamma-aminobutyric acid type B receptor subunit 2-like isoform X1 n=1 Tax=Amphiura filiformis TaxID=82378 RepID=UPI003B21F938